MHRGIDGPPRPGEVKLLISNLHYEVGLDLLAREFGTCGAVMRCRIINGPDGRSRGVAFVSFGEKSSADRAISKYHDRYAFYVECIVGIILFFFCWVLIPSRASEHWL